MPRACPIPARSRPRATCSRWRCRLQDEFPQHYRLFAHQVVRLPRQDLPHAQHADARLPGHGRHQDRLHEGLRLQRGLVGARRQQASGRGRVRRRDRARAQRAHAHAPLPQPAEGLDREDTPAEAVLVAPQRDRRRAATGIDRRRRRAVAKPEVQPVAAAGAAERRRGPQGELADRHQRCAKARGRHADSPGRIRAASSRPPPSAPDIAIAKVAHRDAKAQAVPTTRVAHALPLNPDRCPATPTPRPTDAAGGMRPLRSLQAARRAGAEARLHGSRARRSRARRAPPGGARCCTRQHRRPDLDRGLGGIRPTRMRRPRPAAHARSASRSLPRTASAAPAKAEAPRARAPSSLDATGRGARWHPPRLLPPRPRGLPPPAAAAATRSRSAPTPGPRKPRAASPPRAGPRRRCSTATSRWRCPCRAADKQIFRARFASFTERGGGACLSSALASTASSARDEARRSGAGTAGDSARARAAGGFDVSELDLRSRASCSTSLALFCCSGMVARLLPRDGALPRSGAAQAWEQSLRHHQTQCVRGAPGASRCVAPHSRRDGRSEARKAGTRRRSSPARAMFVSATVLIVAGSVLQILGAAPGSARLRAATQRPLTRTGRAARPWPR